MLNNSPDIGREAFDFIESIQRVSATGGIMDRLRAVHRRSMPDRLKARIGKFQYVRLAAITAALQQFGRFRPLQIISRVDDAGIDFLSRLHADQSQPADGRVLLHDLLLNHAFTTSVLIWIKKNTARAGAFSHYRQVHRHRENPLRPRGAGRARVVVKCRNTVAGFDMRSTVAPANSSLIVDRNLSCV